MANFLQINFSNILPFKKGFRVSVAQTNNWFTVSRSIDVTPALYGPIYKTGASITRLAYTLFKIKQLKTRISEIYNKFTKLPTYIIKKLKKYTIKIKGSFKTAFRIARSAVKITFKSIKGLVNASKPILRIFGKLIKTAGKLAWKGVKFLLGKFGKAMAALFKRLNEHVFKPIYNIVSNAIKEQIRKITKKFGNIYNFISTKTRKFFTTVKNSRPYTKTAKYITTIKNNALCFVKEKKKAITLKIKTIKDTTTHTGKTLYQLVIKGKDNVILMRDNALNWYDNKKQIIHQALANFKTFCNTKYTNFLKHSKIIHAFRWAKINVILAKRKTKEVAKNIETGYNKLQRLKGVRWLRVVAKKAIRWIRFFKPAVKMLTSTLAFVLGASTFGLSWVIAICLGIIFESLFGENINIFKLLKTPFAFSLSDWFWFICDILSWAAPGIVSMPYTLLKDPLVQKIISDFKQYLSWKQDDSYDTKKVDVQQPYSNLINQQNKAQLYDKLDNMLTANDVLFNNDTTYTLNTINDLQNHNLTHQFISAKCWAELCNNKIKNIMSQFKQAQQEKTLIINALI